MGKALEEIAAERRVEETYTVSRLEGDRLIEVWPSIGRELDCIPQYWADRWTKSAMLDAALVGRLQVWAVGPPDRFTFILITQIASYPVTDILQGVVGFGNNAIRGLPVLAATLQKFASIQGCTKMEVEGRPGWEKVLKQFGMKRTNVVLSGPVPNMRVN